MAAVFVRKKTLLDFSKSEWPRFVADIPEDIEIDICAQLQSSSASAATATAADSLS